jgi:hypothetical protein
MAYAIAILAQRSQLAVSRRGNADARCRRDERRTEGDNAEDVAEWAERASEPSTEKFTRHVGSVEQGR